MITSLGQDPLYEVIAHKAISNQKHESAPCFSRVFPFEVIVHVWVVPATKSKISLLLREGPLLPNILVQIVVTELGSVTLVRLFA